MSAVTPSYSAEPVSRHSGSGRPLSAPLRTIQVYLEGRAGWLLALAAAGLLVCLRLTHATGFATAIALAFTGLVAGVAGVKRKDP